MERRCLQIRSLVHSRVVGVVRRCLGEASAWIYPSDHEIISEVDAEIMAMPFCWRFNMLFSAPVDEMHPLISIIITRARHRGIDKLRRERVRKAERLEALDSSPPSKEPSLIAQLIEDEASIAAGQILSQLAHKYPNMFLPYTLYIADGCPVYEIAALLKKSEVAVSKAISRASRKYAEAIDLYLGSAGGSTHPLREVPRRHRKCMRP